MPFVYIQSGGCLACLPAAGYRNGTEVNNRGSNGNYWSSSLNSSNSNNAYYLNFNSNSYDWNNNNRYYGHTVRPVSEFVPLMSSLFLFHLSPEQLLADLYKAYKDARRHKRKRFYQLQFELDFEHELVTLRDELMARTYYPSSSTCFIINEPKKREIFAAEFRDRIVHHLYYNYTSPLFERLFIADSYSCRKNKGTHYCIKRLQHHIRSVSKNYTQRCYVMKIDILGYFMHISRVGLLDICLKDLVKMAHRESDIAGKMWCEKLDYELIFYLTGVIVRNNPLEHCRVKGARADWQGLPHSKSLFHSAEGCGLPIGNLTSQLFSNVYLNEFDCFVKRSLPQFAYGRYVDDAFFVSPSKSALREIIPLLNGFLSSSLNLELHKNKLFITDIRYGVEFLGGFSKPYRCYIANRSLMRMKSKISALNSSVDALFLMASINSFLGILSHYATCRIRKRLFANLDCANKYGSFNKRFMRFKLFRKNNQGPDALFQANNGGTVALFQTNDSCAGLEK